MSDPKPVAGQHGSLTIGGVTVPVTSWEIEFVPIESADTPIIDTIKAMDFQIINAFRLPPEVINRTIKSNPPEGFTDAVHEHTRETIDRRIRIFEERFAAEIIASWNRWTLQVALEELVARPGNPAMGRVGHPAVPGTTGNEVCESCAWGGEELSGSRIDSRCRRSDANPSRSLLCSGFECKAKPVARRRSSQAISAQILVAAARVPSSNVTLRFSHFTVKKWSFSSLR